jgi:hypothetical protein
MQEHRRSPEPLVPRRAQAGVAILATSLATSGALIANVEKPVHTPLYPMGLEINVNPDLSAETAKNRQAIRDYVKDPSSKKPIITLQTPKQAAKQKPRKASYEYEFTMDDAHIILPEPDPITEVGTPPLPEGEEQWKPFKLNPNLPAIPESEKAFMQRNVVRVTPSGCSGILIRNEADTPIGIQSVHHCGLREKDGNRFTDGSGSGATELRFETPVSTQTGDSLTGMQVAGDITEFIINAPTDNSRDLTFGSFAGNSAWDVMKQAKVATPEQLASLRQGDVIWSSGWAVSQPGNDVLKRQDFAMTYLGQTEIEVSNGLKLQVNMAAVPPNKDGTSCSPGQSGSLGYTLLADGTRLNIGAQTAWLDLRATNDPDVGKIRNAIRDNTIRDYERILGVTGLSKFTAICSFVSKLPSEAEGAVAAKVTTRTTPYIPPEGLNPPLPEQSPVIAIQKAEAAFNDPSTPKQIFDGILRLTTGKGVAYVERPMLFYDYERGGVVAAYCTSGENNDGSFVPNHYAQLSFLDTYSNRPDGSAAIIESAGAISMKADENITGFGTCEDETGQQFGRLLNGVDDPELGSPVRIAADKGGELYIDTVPITGGNKGGDISGMANQK